jgi:hypothetical protein
MFLPMAGIVVAVAGAARLATPHSWWARHLYRDAGLLRARRRYENAPDTPDTVLAGLGWLLLALVAALATLYAVGAVDP